MEVERAPPCIVELAGVEARVGSFHLGPVSLALEAGRVTVVIGPNGGGKTTLLRLIAGLIPHRGEVRYCGNPAPATPGRGGLVDYVPAEPQADPYARVEELFKVSGASLDKARRYFPGLDEFLPRRMRELSSGEEKLVCLLRGIASSRRILLLDEPFTHLDVSRQALVLRMLKEEASKGRLIVVAMHELHLLSAIADRVVLLKDGVKLFDIPPSEIEGYLEVIEEAYDASLATIETGAGVILLPSPVDAPGGES
ncbi:MAG: ATP-binding cassette domain-containing protein [Desulfurococcales archaeon]|nr:ATP-binding cassette domain-containing protein [Desulfurococcales archaeon]